MNYSNKKQHHNKTLNYTMPPYIRLGCEWLTVFSYTGDHHEWRKT